MKLYFDSQTAITVNEHHTYSAYFKTHNKKTFKIRVVITTRQSLN